MNFKIYIYIYTVYIYIYIHTYNQCFFLQNPQVLPHFPKKNLLASFGDLSVFINSEIDRRMISTCRCPPMPRPRRWACVADRPCRPNPSWDALKERREHRGDGGKRFFFVVIAVGGVPQIFFGIFTPENGEDEPVLTHIFQRGWNNQLVIGLVGHHSWLWWVKKA